MNNQSDTLKDMLNGFQSLEEFAGNLHLSPINRLKLFGYQFLIAIYQLLVLPFRKGLFLKLESDLKKRVNLSIEIPEHNLQAGPNNHYLSEDEIKAFQARGLTQPFRVISQENAKEIKELVEEAQANDFGGVNYIGADAKKAFQKHQAWGLEKSGLFQAQNISALRNLLERPEISHRLASILGEDVICWRNQFFVKKPGTQGTFWHQNVAFQESSKKRKLTPTESYCLPVVQLTAWIALTDVTIENGAMRMIPGSFQDGRLEKYYEFAVNHRIDFIASLDSKLKNLVLKAALFGSNEFIKAQAVFRGSLAQLGNFLEDNIIEDLTMRAGEAIIFTSLNMHGSYPNTSEEDTRFAFVGRFTTNSVKVFDGMERDIMATPEGYKSYSTLPLRCIQVHGKDEYGHNRILEVSTEEAIVSPC
ncbi:MAG: phytanoyl-CoA dioxygenase family protein [Bacteroidota bacterium]